MDNGSISEQAIREYQPAWKPERGALAGWVIALDAIGGGAEHSSQRYLDDLALLTGGHLYHLIQRAGSVPVMTRADDYPVGGEVDARSEHVKAFCERQLADLAISIEFVATGAECVSAAGGDDLSQLLARQIGENSAIGAVSEGRDAVDSTEIGVPWAQVRLVAPDSRGAESECWEFRQKWAEQLFRGIAAFVSALEKLRPTEVRTRKQGTVHAVPFLPDRTWDDELEQAARSIWPGGDLPTEQAGWFVGVYRKAVLSDRSVVYFEPRVKIEAGTVVIGGATNLEILRDTPAAILRAVGVGAVINEMRLLPEEGRLEGEWFGACVASMTLMYGGPSEAASMQTQLLYGEPLLLLDREDGFYLVQGGDGYWGWVREATVRLLDWEEFTKQAAERRAVVQRDLELSGRRIVSGVALPVAAVTGAEAVLQLHEGESVAVPIDGVHIADDRSVVEERIARALALLHRPYVYGAVSPLGLDCSGFVRNIFSQTGVSMARNAAQQFMHGRLVATRWHRAGILPGDLLYFINPAGKIYHVGIALTPTHFIHSSPPEVQINSLEPGDRLYSESRARSFFAARRLP